MGRVVRVGSRESLLAVRQAEIVMNAVRKSPGIELELVTIKTEGDLILDRSLDELGGKGLFVGELEQALRDSRIDIAVHSYKDLPYEETEELPIVALSERESALDALILPLNEEALDETKPVGSSSRRRSLQFKALYNLETAPVRGNVVTRLAKLDNGEYSALILAQAGLNRLGLHNRVSRLFTPEEMIPSASQGILAVQGRAGEDYSYLTDFHSVESECASKAERGFIRTLGCGCSSPAAAYCEVRGREIRLTGMYEDDYGRMEKGGICGVPEDAERIGERLAQDLIQRAARARAW